MINDAEREAQIRREYERLAALATPGPWTANRGGLNHPAWVCYSDKERAKIEHAGNTGSLIWAADEGERREDPDRDVRFRGGEADEQLVAFLRNNAGEMFMRLDEVRAEIERLYQAAELVGGGADMQAYHDLNDAVVIYKTSDRGITAGDIRRAREYLGSTSMMNFRREQTAPPSASALERAKIALDLEPSRPDLAPQLAEEFRKLCERVAHTIEHAEREKDRIWSECVDALGKEIAALRNDVVEAREVATDIGLEAIRFTHEWIGGLPIKPSFEDKRAAQVALELAEQKLRGLAADPKEPSDA